MERAEALEALLECNAIYTREFAQELLDALEIKIPLPLYRWSSVQEAYKKYNIITNVESAVGVQMSELTLSIAFQMKFKDYVDEYDMLSKTKCIIRELERRHK